MGSVWRSSGSGSRPTGQCWPVGPPAGSVVSAVRLRRHRARQRHPQAGARAVRVAPDDVARHGLPLPVLRVRSWLAPGHQPGRRAARHAVPRRAALGAVGDRLPAPDGGPRRRGLRRFDGDPHAWWADFVARGEAQPHPDDMLLLLQYGCSAAFTPGSDLRPVLPFDTRTGKLDDDLWSRWLALDPVRMAPAAGDVLRSLSAIWVDAGTPRRVVPRPGSRGVRPGAARGRRERGRVAPRDLRPDARRPDVAVRQGPALPIAERLPR